MGIRLIWGDGGRSDGYRREAGGEGGNAYLIRSNPFKICRLSWMPPMLTLPL